MSGGFAKTSGLPLAPTDPKPGEHRAGIPTPPATGTPGGPVGPMGPQGPGGSVVGSVAGSWTDPGTIRAVIPQLLFVLGATLIAGASDKAATVVLVIMVALGILWTIGHLGGPTP